MASPRPPPQPPPQPPPPLPVIKQRTRALQQKLKQRAAQTTLNASSSSSSPLSPSHQATFPVIQSEVIQSEASHVHSTEGASTASTPLVSADTAIARLRTYRDEQLLWHTAVEHCDRRALLVAVSNWRHAISFQSQPHLPALVHQLTQQHRTRLLRSAVQHWKTATNAGKQHAQQHGHLARFCARHVQRLYFVAWVAHTLHRADKEAGLLLARSLHRSNTLRAVWRLWRETAEIAARQRELEQRAERHASVQLTEHALTIWRAQGSQAVKEREKEQKAAQLGDRRSKHYYLQRWRQLPGMVREDEQAAPRLSEQTNQRIARDAWQAWRQESEWRHAAQLASYRLVRWREQWLVKAAWDGWEGIVDDEKVSEQRTQQADKWHHRQCLHQAVQQWRATNRAGKAQRIRDRHGQLGLQQSVQHWREWAHQQRLTQTAQRHYEHSTAAQTLGWWRQQLQLSMEDRQLRERARTHEYESRMVSALRLWQHNAIRERQRKERIATATTYQRVRLLRNGLAALSSHRHQRLTERQHASLVRCHQLQSAVILLYQHAAYQRSCWQQHLRAKRFRYFHSLRQAWHSWHEARHQDAAADERLFTERCGGLVHQWTGQLFSAWLRLTVEQRVARERETVALVHWSGRLTAEAWQEWQMAVLDRTEEQQRFRIADGCLQRSSQRHALTSWLSYTRYKRQIREAESETVAIGRQQLQLLAQRRAWHRIQLAFHTSRTHRFDLNKAAEHHNRHSLHHTIHTWHSHSATSAHHTRLSSTATTAHGRRLLLLAWRHWLAIQAERRRLLALHVRAREWRSVREERRVWAGWKRWVAGRRAQRQREADMRRLRTERLQVEGVRQWVMVGMEWLEQKQEMEAEARQSEQRSDRRHSQQQRVRAEAVTAWVRRICDHWRHRIAQKDEARQPLITRAQLTRWREGVRATRRQQLERQARAATDEHMRLHQAAERSATVSAAANLVDSSVLPAFSPSSSSTSSSAWSSAIVLPSAVSYRGRARPEPRRHVELLLDDTLTSDPFSIVSAPAAPDVSQLSTSLPPNSHPLPLPLEPPHFLPPQHPPLSPHPHPPSAMSCSAVDEALLAALSAAPSSPPPLDVSAIESRLHFLAGLRSAYHRNKLELDSLQAYHAASSNNKSSSSSGGNQPAQQLGASSGSGMADEAEAAARCALLLHACLEFEQQRLEWKREVQQWQQTIRREQLRSGG